MVTHRQFSGVWRWREGKLYTRKEWAKEKKKTSRRGRTDGKGWYNPFVAIWCPWKTPIEKGHTAAAAVTALWSSYFPSAAVAPLSFRNVSPPGNSIQVCVWMWCATDHRPLTLFSASCVCVCVCKPIQTDFAPTSSRTFIQSVSMCPNWSGQPPFDLNIMTVHDAKRVTPGCSFCIGVYTSEINESQQPAAGYSKSNQHPINFQMGDYLKKKERKWISE